MGAAWRASVQGASRCLGPGRVKSAPLLFLDFPSSQLRPRAMSNLGSIQIYRSEVGQIIHFDGFRNETTIRRSLSTLINS